MPAAAPAASRSFTLPSSLTGRARGDPAANHREGEVDEGRPDADADPEASVG